MSRLGVRVLKLARALLQPRRRPASTVKRILVAHNLLLGDTILLAPLLKALALRYPEAERVVLCRPAYVPLFAGAPYGAKALAFERRSAESQRAVMRSGPYDLALVPDDNRYAWLARAAGARWIVGFANDRPAWKNWMLDEAMTYPTEPAAWADMALALAHSESVPAYRVGEWPAPLPGRGHEQLARLGTRYAVLHVGASTPLKLWPAERWRLLADELRRRHCEIVWSAGAGEDEVLKAVGVRPGEHSLVGTLDLGSLWALLAGAQLLVCPDTGIAHLARVVGVPTIALFGPGSAIVHGPGRFWKDAPYWVVTDASYPCRDQTVLYRRDIAWVARCGRGFGPAPGQCPRAGCMEVLAFDAVKDLLESACALPR